MADKNPGDGEYDFAPEAPAAPREETRAPEQRTKKSEPPPRPQPAETPELVMPESICPHCGFKIIGRPLRGRCPECSARLDELAADRLQFSDGAWLTTVSNGALLAALDVILLPVGTVMEWMGKGDLGAMIHAAAGVAAAAGIWLATQPEPGPSAKKSTLAAWARWAAVAMAAFWLMPLAKRGPAEGRDIVVMLILAAMGLEGLLASLHFRALAVRVPNDSVAAQLWNLAIGLPVVCLVLVGLQATGLADIRKVDQYFLCGFSTIAGLAVVVLWTTITLLRLGVELRNCVSAGLAIEARKAMKAKAQEKK